VSAALPDGDYEVLIDSTLADGTLTYGEYLHRGESEDEFLLTAHICHPSLANDNCSGLALLTILAEHLRSLHTRLSYRFLFSPGTIGPVSWLAANEANLGRIKHGLVVAGVGDGLVALADAIVVDSLDADVAVGTSRLAVAAQEWCGTEIGIVSITTDRRHDG